MDTSDELRGADKKEAFHQAAEAKVHTFSFAVPDVDAPNGRINCYHAETDACSLVTIIMRNGYFEPAHYHPNQDGIWMVLKGKVRFYGGAHDERTVVLGPMEGIVQPENSRYWFAHEGDEEAWLLQIGGYPKGKKVAKRVPLDPNEGRIRSVRVQMRNLPLAEK